MADGEDIGKIMSESRAEMVRLGMLKNQIESETHQLIEASAKSEEDIDDLFNTANKLLESQGIAPIEDNPLVKRSLMRELGLKKSKKKRAYRQRKRTQQSKLQRRRKP